MIRAEVTINPYHTLGEIAPLFYGQYVESLDPPAKPIYGGVCDENGALREDVIRDLKEMKVPVIRWGGNYADLLHWQDSIGSRENRPVHYNYQWGGTEPNQFGTHEFLELCSRLNAAPYININLGTGSLQETLGWLEYCNYSGDTTLTRLRKKNGRTEPWHVGIWGIGNESWGLWEASFSTSEVYADRFNRYAEFMRKFDPSIQLVGVGWNHSAWNQTVLQKIVNQPEYLSIHLYGHSHIGSENNYERLVGTPVFFEKYILPGAAEDIRRFGKKPIGITVDEWNVRHFFNGKINRASPRRMEDALFSAGFLNVMQRQSAAVKMTNQTCMVNSLAPLIATPTGTLRTPLYEVFKLYQELCLTQVIVVQVVSPTYRCEPTACTQFDKLVTAYDADYLDASATTNADHSQITVVLVNRHSQDKMCVNVRIPYSRPPQHASLCLVTAESPEALQASVNVIPLQTYEEIELPPHSFGFLVME